MSTVMPAQIVIVTTPTREVHTFLLKPGRNLVGRAEGADIFIDDATASRAHAEIYYDAIQNTLTIRDLYSVNGTFVNHERLGDSRILEPGDLVQVGECTLVIDLQEPPAASDQSPAKTAPLTKALIFESLGRHSRLLYDVAARLNTILDSETALAEVADLMRAAMGADRCMVIRADQFGSLHELGFPSVFALRAIREKSAIVIPVVGPDPAQAGVSAMLLRVRSALCVPVMSGEEVMALVYAYKTSPLAPPFDQTDLQVAVAISHQAALTLQRTELVKITEQVLRDSERRIRTIVGSSPDIIFSVESNTFQPKLLNRDELLDYVKDEFEKSDVRRLNVHIDDSWAVTAYWDDLAHRKAGSNPVASIEFRLYTKQGQLEWVQCRSVVLEFDPDGRPRQFLATLTVITRHRQAQEQLQKSEAMLAEAQQLAHLGSWEWRITEDRIAGSDEFYRMYGVPGDPGGVQPEHIIGRIHPADRFHVLRAVRQALKTRDPFLFHHRHSLENGDIRIFHAQGWVSVANTGRPISLYGTVQDVTEIQQAERALKRRGEELSVLNDVVTTLNSSMDEQAIMTFTLERIVALLAVDAAACHMLTESGQLRLAAQYGLSSVLDPETLEDRIPADFEDDLQAMATRDHIEVADLQADPDRRGASLARRAGFRFAITLPIMGRDRPLGTLGLYARHSRTLDVDTRSLLKTIGAQLGVALERINLYASQHKRAEQLARSSGLITALSRVTARLLATLNPDSVMETLGAELRALGVTCFIFLANPTSEGLILHYTSLDEATVARVEASIQNKLVRSQIPADQFPFYDTLVRQRQVMYIPGTGPLALIFSSTRPKALARQIGELDQSLYGASMIYLPLAIEDRVLAVLAVAGPGLKNDDVPAFTAFGGEVAIVLENARLFEEVRSGRERLSKVTHQVMRAQEDERRRVARELHDEAGQALTALKIELSLIGNDLPAENRGLRDRLSGAANLVDLTLQEIRLLAQALRPPSLDTLHNISLTLEVYCREFSRRTQLPILYTGVELPTLTDEANICLYRFLQEALTNVAKHAQAPQVWVELRRESGEILLSVQDDGVGLPSSSYSNGEGGPGLGIGLLGMQERLELLGGRLELESQPGDGTRVVAHLPGERSTVKMDEGV